MSEIQNHRRQLIVNRVFQYKTLLYISLLILATVVISNLAAMIAAKWLGGGQLAVPAAQAIPAASQPAFSWDLVLIPGLAAALIGILVALFFGLHYSHRIAGPLFNLKRVLNRLGGGDLNTVMHIRSGDEFHDLEATFNQMMRDLNYRFDRVVKLAEALPEPHRAKLLSQMSEVFSLGKDESAG